MCKWKLHSQIAKPTPRQATAPGSARAATFTLLHCSVVEAKGLDITVCNCKCVGTTFTLGSAFRLDNNRTDEAGERVSG